MATKAEIIEDLEWLGVDFDPYALKAELETLLLEAIEPTPEPEPEGQPRRTARSFKEERSGLCRQCGKPADHKHIGV